MSVCEQGSQGAAPTVTTARSGSWTSSGPGPSGAAAASAPATACSNIGARRSPFVRAKADPADAALTMAPSGGRARPDVGGSGEASRQAKQIVRWSASLPSSDLREARTAAFSARKTSSSFDVLRVSAANAKRATKTTPDAAARPSPVESIGAGCKERAVSTKATCSPSCKAATLGPDAANSSACATLRHFKSEARQALGALGPSAPAAPSAAVASSAPATRPNHGVAEALTSAAAQVKSKAHVASPKESPGALDQTSNRSTNASPSTSSERHAITQIA